MYTFFSELYFAHGQQKAYFSVCGSNAYSGSRQQTEGGDVAFTAIDTVFDFNANFSCSHQEAHFLFLSLFFILMHKCIVLEG